jgi:hypothetical protein
MAGVLQRRTGGNGNEIDDQMQNGVDYWWEKLRKFKARISSVRRERERGGGAGRCSAELARVNARRETEERWKGGDVEEQRPCFGVGQKGTRPTTTKQIPRPLPRAIIPSLFLFFFLLASRILALTTPKDIYYILILIENGASMLILNI